MKIVRSLLIVDDNPADVDLCELTFEPTGRYPVILSASTGQAALDMLRAGGEHLPPSVMLVDINMPGMSGFEFLEAYAAEGLGDSSVAILMLSSSTDPRDRERATATGLVQDYLVKPPSEEVAIRIADTYGDWVEPTSAG